MERKPGVSLLESLSPADFQIDFRDGESGLGVNEEMAVKTIFRLLKNKGNTWQAFTTEEFLQEANNADSTVVASWQKDVSLPNLARDGYLTKNEGNYLVNEELLMAFDKLSISPARKAALEAIR